MEVQAHILPAAILVECWMPQEMTDSLNDYLDDLLKRKDRISHAGTLVGQISQGEQLTMNQHDSRIAGYCDFIQELGANYVSHVMKVIGQPLPGGRRKIEIDEIWSVHSFEGDYNPIHDHGTKTIMGISTTCWTKVPKEILGVEDKSYSLYNASGHSDGCLAFNYGRNSMQDIERLRPPQSAVFKPEVGKLLMFPSWLQHMVYPFKSKEERRTVAANLNAWMQDGEKVSTT